MQAPKTVPMMTSFLALNLDNLPETLTFELLAIISKSLATKFPAMDISCSLHKGTYPTLGKYPKFKTILETPHDKLDMLNTVRALAERV